MMGWQTGDQRQLFYLFNLEQRIPASATSKRARKSCAGYSRHSS